MAFEAERHRAGLREAEGLDGGRGKLSHVARAGRRAKGPKGQVGQSGAE